MKIAEIKEIRKMNEFLKFLNEKVKDFPMHIEIFYNKGCDWNIYIYKRGCAEDYLKSPANGQDAIICAVQSSDMELAFAEAQVAVKKWFLENRGGY